MKFSKYNQPRRRHRKINRIDADIIVSKNMFDDMKRGIELPLSHYDEQSDKLCGLPSRNIYNN